MGNQRMAMAEQFFKLRGGKVIDSFDIQHPSHIFVDPDSFDAGQFLTEFNVSREELEDIRFVNFEWIIKCFRLGTKCSGKSFQLEI